MSTNQQLFERAQRVIHMKDGVIDREVINRPRPARSPSPFIG